MKKFNAELETEKVIAFIRDYYQKNNLNNITNNFNAVEHNE